LTWARTEYLRLELAPGYGDIETYGVSSRLRLKTAN
jgi:hypothetical protein